MSGGSEPISTEQLDERLLVLRCQAGDERALTELIDQRRCAETVHYAHGQRRFVDIVAFVQMAAPLHHHHWHAIQLATNEIPFVREGGRMRQVRNVAIGNGHFRRDFIGQVAEARPQNDCDLRSAAPTRAHDGESVLEHLFSRHGKVSVHV